MNPKWSFEAPLNRETVYSNERLADTATHYMELFLANDGQSGTIEWTVDGLDIVEHIGVWFDGKELIDYDGVFEMPSQALDFLESLGYTVEVFR